MPGRAGDIPTDNLMREIEWLTHGPDIQATQFFEKQRGDGDCAKDGNDQQFSISDNGNPGTGQDVAGRP